METTHTVSAWSIPAAPLASALPCVQFIDEPLPFFFSALSVAVSNCVKRQYLIFTWMIPPLGGRQVGPWQTGSAVNRLQLDWRPGWPQLRKETDPQDWSQNSGAVFRVFVCRSPDSLGTDSSWTVHGSPVPWGAGSSWTLTRGSPIPGGSDSSWASVRSSPAQWGAHSSWMVS